MNTKIQKVAKPIIALFDNPITKSILRLPDVVKCGGAWTRGGIRAESYTCDTDILQALIYARKAQKETFLKKRRTSQLLHPISPTLLSKALFVFCNCKAS